MLFRIADRCFVVAAFSRAGGARSAKADAVSEAE